MNINDIANSDALEIMDECRIFEERGMISKEMCPSNYIFEHLYREASKDSVGSLGNYRQLKLHIKFKYLNELD
jgi:hypothetical protein